MAKDDTDFASDDSGNSPDGKADSRGFTGLLAKLPAPITRFFAGIRDFFENFFFTISTAFNDKERPFMPIVMLGGAVLVLLVLVLIMFAVLGTAVSSSASGKQSGSSIAIQTDQVSTANPPRGELVGPMVGGDRALSDPFLGQAILPDEPQFMLQGEIHYQRSPQAFWSTADIKPGWQDLGGLYRIMLREHNRADFYKMMGETPPPPDRY